MQFLANTTSPYVRIARISMIEKGVDIEPTIVDPWADDARLRAAPLLGGAAPCAADIGIFPFVRQFAATDPVWWAAQPLPAVQAWLAGWLTHPLFERAMRKWPEAGAAQSAR